MKLQYYKLNSNAYAPIKKNKSDAGWDILAPKNITLLPESKEVIHTGLIVWAKEPIRQHFYWRVAEKSRFADKGLSLHGGVIDRYYRDELIIVAHNTSLFYLEFAAGKAFCQIIPTMILDIQEAEESLIIPEVPERGAAGFGSTEG